MSKAKDPNVSDPDLDPEYDFSGGERGTYYERARKGGRVVLVSEADDARRTSAPRTSAEQPRDPD